MTTEPAPTEPEGSAAARFRLPAAAPEPVSDAERAAFAQLARESLPAVRASAQSWRNGLTALVSLAAAGVFVQGRSATADLATTWRGVVTVLIGGGLVAAGVGLWYALAAEAGGRAAPLTLADIHARHASVEAYQVALANRAAGRLHRARIALGVSLALLIAGALVTWWAPAALPASSAAAQVSGQAPQTAGVVVSTRCTTACCTAKRWCATSTAVLACPGYGGCVSSFHSSIH